MNKVKPLVKEEDRKRFMAALEEYWQTGTTKVACDQCGSVIRFHQLGSATKHECDCGKFTGTLRGL
jgi:hypothetical protein